VGIRRGTFERQTHRQTHRRPWPIYISPRLCLTRNVITRRSLTVIETDAISQSIYHFLLAPNQQRQRTLGGRNGIRSVKNMGDSWDGHCMVSPDGMAPIRMVGVSASVNLPLHHKVQNWQRLTRVVPEKGPFNGWGVVLATCGSHVALVPRHCHCLAYVTACDLESSSKWATTYNSYSDSPPMISYSLQANPR